MKKLVYLLLLLPIFSCQKEEKLQNKFAGAWEVEKITITHFANGQDSFSQEYANCGTWSFFDNGMSGNTFNLSYLSLKQAVPTVFMNNLQQQTDGSFAGFIDWGGADADDKRILFEIENFNNGNDMALTVEKINRNKFVFFYFITDPQNGDHMKELQRFELKRAKG